MDDYWDPTPCFLSILPEVGSSDDIKLMFEENFLELTNWVASEDVSDSCITRSSMLMQRFGQTKNENKK